MRLLFVIAATVVTYPLAYRRRVRQLIEGARAADSSQESSVAADRVLHAWSCLCRSSVRSFTSSARRFFVIRGSA